MGDIIAYMGTYVFNNEIFNSWLNKKADEILSKVDRETISTEEMIILLLKAQTNHFYHVDIDLKKGLADLDTKIEKGLAALDKKIEHSDTRISSLERRIDLLDQKIDNRFMWTIGISIAMSAGIYLKLFLG